MQETKLLVIVITTVAIIVAVTTTSLSAATPAFANINCNEDASVCSGGGKLQSSCGTFTTCNGGTGGRSTITGNEITHSGGGGINGDTLVGGGGDHSVCDLTNPSDCSVNVGGSGLHPK